MGLMISKPKRMRDKNAIDLRIAAHSKDQLVAAAAKFELRRRVGNLRGAVIPPWEKKLRGPDPALWDILV